MAIDMDEVHGLYRFFSKDGELLYIGISANPLRRADQHSLSKDWWREVYGVTIEQKANRAEVLEAEREAIQRERPKYNVIHNRERRDERAREERQPLSKDEVREYPVKPADVVALCLSDGECPVGSIKDVSPFGVTLLLYSWLSGYFGCGMMVAPWHRIDEIVFAAEKERVKERSVITGKIEETVVYDMDPLGDTQVRWNARHGVEERHAIERQAVQRMRAMFK